MDDVEIISVSGHPREDAEGCQIEHKGTVYASVKQGRPRIYHYKRQENGTYTLTGNGVETIFNWDDDWKTNKSLKAAIKFCR